MQLQFNASFAFSIQVSNKQRYYKQLCRIGAKNFKLAAAHKVFYAVLYSYKNEEAASAS
jgi:hypothetical protein